VLPLSVGHTSSLRSATTQFVTARWGRPTNVAATARADLRARVIWLGFCVGLGVLIALGHVWLRLQVVTTGYRLSVTRQIVERLDQEQRELTLDIARLSTAARIDEVARQRLGMTRPDKGQEAVLP